jgi:hypothetical protein
VPQCDTQETPAAHALPPGPAVTPHKTALWPGLGLTFRDQLAPLKRKISVRATSDAVRQCDAQEVPAAQALPPGPALTEFSLAIWPGLGLAARDQLPLFQRKMSVRSTSDAVPQRDAQE